LIKCKVGLPHAYVALTDFGYSVQTIWLTCSQRHLHYLAFQSMRASDEVFPKTCCANLHFIIEHERSYSTFRQFVESFRTD